MYAARGDCIILDMNILLNARGGSLPSIVAMYCPKVWWTRRNHYYIRKQLCIVETYSSKEALHCASLAQWEGTLSHRQTCHSQSWANKLGQISISDEVTSSSQDLHAFC